MKNLKIIILLGIVFAGSHFQMEAMFGRLTTQGMKANPGQIAKQLPPKLPSKIVLKQDKDASSEKQEGGKKGSSTFSEKSIQTQAVQTSESKASKKKESLYSRISKKNQGSDQNTVPKQTITRAIGDWINSGKQTMAAAWNSIMNSFYKTPSEASVMPLVELKAPAQGGRLIAREKLSAVENTFGFGAPQQIPQKLYSAPSSIVELTAIEPVGKSEAQKESEDIIGKLKGKNPWGYSAAQRRDAWHALESPLAKQIEEFFEKNSTGAIENVFYSLLENKSLVRSEGHYILEHMIKYKDSLEPKLFPLLEKYADKVDDQFLGTILLRLPPEQLVEAKNMIDNFLEKRPAHLFVRFSKPEFISRLLLPKDTARFVSTLRKICEKCHEREVRFANDEEKKHYNQIISILTNSIAEKFGDIEPTNDDLKILTQELELFDTDKNRFVLPTWMFENDDLFKKLIFGNPKLKNSLINYIKREKGSETAEQIRGLSKVLDGPDFIEMVLGIDNSYAQTPSYEHLVKFSREIESSKEVNFESIVKTPNMKNMIQKVIANEKKLIEQGKKVYYHGRRRQYEFLSDVYRMLLEYKSGKKLKDFIPVHLDDPVLGNVSEKFFQSEQKNREGLAAEGNTFSFYNKVVEQEDEDEVMFFNRTRAVLNRNRLLFLNKFLFGNIHNRGSNSLYYILHNKNVGDIDFSVKDIFSMFGYSDVYKAHEKKLLALQEKHKALSNYGELLQIAIPKENLSETVYFTTSGGPRLEFKMPDGSTTADIKVISEELDREPQADVEFAAIATHDKKGILNPDSGIKMFSYNLDDPDKRAAFKEEEKNEFAAIVNDLVKKDTQESGALSESSEVVNEKKEAVEVA